MEILFQKLKISQALNTAARTNKRNRPSHNIIKVNHLKVQMQILPHPVIIINLKTIK